jgi:hypothetical protein
VRSGKAAIRRWRARKGDRADEHMVLARVVDPAVLAGDPEPVRERNHGARAEVQRRISSPLVQGEGDPAALMGAA